MGAAHHDLASGRWHTMTLVEQLANVGSEVNRAIEAQAGGRVRRRDQALKRALELSTSPERTTDGAATAAARCSGCGRSSASCFMWTTRLRGRQRRYSGTSCNSASWRAGRPRRRWERGCGCAAGGRGSAAGGRGPG